MGAVLGGCLVTPVALAVFIVRKILNPLYTVKDARRFANYAFSKNSITLKTVSLITLASAIVLSPLAALQYGLKKLIVDPVNTLLTTKLKVIREQNGENMISDYDKYIQFQKNESLKKVINSFTAEIDKKTKVDDAEIGANPEKALAAFKTKLEDDQHCIPVFNKEIQMKVIGYINKHPEKREDYDALMLKAANRVVGVVEQYKEEAKEAKKIKPN